MISQLPVEISLDEPGEDNYGCDYDPLYEARALSYIEPARKSKDDDSMVDSEARYRITPEGDRIAEGSYLSEQAAIDYLRASVIRELALPEEFHNTHEIVRLVGGGPEEASNFDAASMDVEKLIEEQGTHQYASLDKLARIAAHNGARLLVNVHPGWHLEVDATTLDQRRDLWCVLAQLHGTYHNGLFELEDYLRISRVDLGFDEGTASLERFQIPIVGEYITLCWQYEISSRL